MARDVLREAEKTKDQNRKKALLDIAKLYNQTGLNMEADAQDNSPPRRSA